MTICFPLRSGAQSGILLAHTSSFCHIRSIKKVVSSFLPLIPEELENIRESERIKCDLRMEDE